MNTLRPSFRPRMIGYSALVIAAMIGVTTWASLEKGVTQGAQELVAERWGVATLFDAYFGFLIFYGWVHTKESSPWKRLGWFAGIMGLGNIAMGAYLMKEAIRLRPGEGLREFLLPRTKTSA